MDYLKITVLVKVNGYFFLSSLTTFRIPKINDKFIRTFRENVL
ncbi:hypothetical protein D348_02152 [Enterococcus faecalis SLO2C-1]|nr:hypothetical protein D348_02152 [Enterococcus faecalis SLO2C-1]